MFVDALRWFPAAAHPPATAALAPARRASEIQRHPAPVADYYTQMLVPIKMINAITNITKLLFILLLLLYYQKKYSNTNPTLIIITMVILKIPQAQN